MNRPGASRFRPRFFLPPAPPGAAPRGGTARETGPPWSDLVGAEPPLSPEDSRHALVGAEFSLSPEDSRHARTVLRLQPGDACEVVVRGAATGGATPGAAVCAATVSSVGDTVNVVVDTILDEVLAGASYRFEVGIVQALARPAVMDYVFEKGTEVGASFFLLAAAAGSPKWAVTPSGDRLERWTRVIREAAKQSKQVAVPRVLFAGTVAQALDHAAGLQARSFVLEPGAPSTLDAALRDSGVSKPGDGPVALWIGPEGGWNDEEGGRFESARLTAVRLGRSVLRTETAGPVAVAVTRLLLDDW
jgi:16S rRNA (uracil1498-N3)-methyltransferase